MLRFSVSPEVVDERLGVGWVRVERGEQLERLADRHAIGQLALLELDAHDLPQAITIVLGIKPQDADRAAIGLAQAGDRLDGRGLAGAIRAEDAEDLALFHGERNAIHGRLAAVVLGEVGDFYDIHAPMVAAATPWHIGGAAAFRRVFG